MAVECAMWLAGWRPSLDHLPKKEVIFRVSLQEGILQDSGSLTVWLSMVIDWL